MFDMVTSRDFLAKLEAEFAAFVKEPGSARLALNCAMTAYHLHEWIWGDWLNKDFKTKARLKIRDKNEFLAFLDAACPWFPAVQELTNGMKHFRGIHSFEAKREDFDASAWSGYMPYVRADGKILVIDFGPDAGAERWQPAGFLLAAVVHFWQQFFETHAPPLLIATSLAGEL